MMIREKQDLKAWNQERKVETGREKKGTGGMSFKNLNIRLLFLQGWGWL